MGVLHWPPPAFWGASFYDIYRAVAGWRRANGVGQPTAGGTPPPLSAEKCDELHDMVLRFEAKERTQQRELVEHGNQGR